jgi:two-component system LytT family response regulator
MPDYNGYEIVSFFENIDFNIIFITAYDKYALKAFEISATDYLLKPIEIVRLKSAVERASKQLVTKQNIAELQKLAINLKKSNQKYAYTDRGMTHYIMVSEIIAIEAQRSYSTFRLVNNKQITVSKNIKTVSSELSNFTHLVRTHRSWIVNIDHIISYSKTNMTIVMVEDITAKLSRAYKDAFQANIAQ